MAVSEQRQETGTKVTLLTLAALVIGSMVGAGVFYLPSRFARETGVAGALVAWGIAGAGMLMLCFVFQTLAIRKPELDSGVYAYAKAGFGQYPGFFSAFGFWASVCVSNTFYWVLIMSTIGAIAPALGEGDTLLAAALSSVGVWFFYWLIRRGIKEAAGVNRVVTFAKVIPILFFIVLCVLYLDPQVFADNFDGGDYGSLFSQVTGTMLVTVFVFGGIESASVYSRQAKGREDVGKATLLGFLSVLAVFSSVTIVSYGIIPYQQIADLRQPSMGGVLKAAVGDWGMAFIGVGLILSVLGAYLAWTLMAAEVLFVAAKNDDMPRFLTRTSGDDVPTAAVLMTTLLVQVMLFVLLFASNALDLALELTAALGLIPYVLSAGYALKLAITRETYDDPKGRRHDLVVGSLATVYTAFLLYAAGLRFVLLSFIVVAPGTILFVMARREQGKRLFSPAEFVILAISVVGAIAGIIALATGTIAI